MVALNEWRMRVMAAPTNYPVGVELWISGPRVEVVVGDGGDPGDADLSHGAVAV